ncbi:aldo-keto reductase family 1 member B1-like [Phalacrocorax carbo]|uniref:aldo-keto reductase family 1 member B1-like n=1 Tax=Phalacrocorax carbo TaxID=9209 RepID=UPI00311A24A4
MTAAHSQDEIFGIWTKEIPGLIPGQWAIQLLKSAFYFHRSKPEDICLFDDPQVKEIALKYNKTTAQVLTQLQIRRNVSPIPKSVTPHHSEENFKVFDFELAKEGMETFLAFKKQYCICALSECKNRKDYPFLED